MGNISFEWDAAKASLNKKKHGVSFSEAKTVFFDGHAKVIHDPEYSSDEERFIILGLSCGYTYAGGCALLSKK